MAKSFTERMQDMNFSHSQSIRILERTPEVVRAMLGGLSGEMAESSGRTDDWAPFDVLGHLVHGEIADWIPRARIILEQGENRTFEPFDRIAQFERSRGKNLADLLDEFESLRRANIETLRGWRLTEEQLDLGGIHPELGPASLRQLIATWAVHDLNHIRQIATAMARRYDSAVGPWRAYLSILK